MTMRNKNFAVFILTHGRPDNVITFNTLKRCGYTGAIHFICDNEDSRLAEYKERFGAESVIVFDKKKFAAQVDDMNNFGDRHAVVYARNYSFIAAKELGLTHFVQLDDDYTRFDYTFGVHEEYACRLIRNVDRLFDLMVDFLKSTPVTCVALTQGGDMIGGAGGDWRYRILRKVMNTMFCVTDRPFSYTEYLNEDVNAYVVNGSRGMLFYTVSRARILQTLTQLSSGGLTDAYLKYGTYVKSFYSVMAHPSSVTAGFSPAMDRIHHRVMWDKTVPKLLPESCRKSRKKK